MTKSNSLVAPVGGLECVSARARSREFQIARGVDKFIERFDVS